MLRLSVIFGFSALMAAFPGLGVMSNWELASLLFYVFLALAVLCLLGSAIEGLTRKTASVLFHGRIPMTHQLRAVAFDLDEIGLSTLRDALPQWRIDSVDGATAASMVDGWNPGAADLLVIQARGEAQETLALCRFLAFCGPFSTAFREAGVGSGVRHSPEKTPARRTQAPLLILMGRRERSLRRAAMEAGADACLALPLTSAKLLATLAGMQQRTRRSGVRSSDHAEAVAYGGEG